jgi:hypothetical protein
MYHGYNSIMALGKLKALVPRTLNNVCHSCQSEMSIGRQSAQIKGPRVPKKSNLHKN